MGYETEVYLVDKGHEDFFIQWKPASEHWYTSNRRPLDEIVRATGEVNGDPLQDCPDDSLFSDGGVIIASLKMGKIGGGSGGGLEGELDDFFEYSREKQKKEHKFLLLKWIPTDCHNSDEWPDVTDPYGDPYTIHDAQGTLDALNRSIARQVADGDQVYRRYTMLKAMLEVAIPSFHNLAVVTRGY